jgi:hypothetical protein
MSIPQFVSHHGLRPADAVVLTKKFFGMVDHFVIYLGIRNLQHTFIANYVEGVRIIPNQDVEKYLQTLVPKRIEKYPGQEWQRGEAITRALSQLGQKAYNYIANNCEHFKNFVHYGIKHSTQVQKTGGLIALGGLGLTLFGVDKKKDGMAITGVFIILIGIIIALLGTPSSDEKAPSQDQSKKLL